MGELARLDVDHQTNMDEGKCYVGQMPGTNRMSVACDGGDGSGPFKLAQAGYTMIVLGPTTWDRCAEYMRQHNQPGW